MNSMNVDMDEHFFDRAHPEHLRWNKVIAPECYLADEPQAYLTILIEAVRPHTEICHPCKSRCLSSLVKAISSDNVYWNTKPHVIYPGETLSPSNRLEARLEMMGINQSNNYGLDLPDSELLKYFEPQARKLMLLNSLWEPLASTANDLIEFAERNLVANKTSDSDLYIGDKLEYMCLSAFPIDDLVFGRQPSELILLMGRILSQWKPDPVCCTCTIYNNAPVLAQVTSETTSTGSTTITRIMTPPDLIQPKIWPAIVLSAAKKCFSPQIVDSWTQSTTTNGTTPPIPVPLSESYSVHYDLHKEWVIDWLSKYTNSDMSLPSCQINPNLNDPTKDSNINNPNYSPHSARMDALRLFLLHEFDPLWSEFTQSPQFRYLSEVQGPSRLQEMESSVYEEHLGNEYEFVAGGGSELYTGIGQLPRFVVEEERKRTLRHYRNNTANMRFWEVWSDLSDPFEYPEEWARLT